MYRRIFLGAIALLMLITAACQPQVELTPDVIEVTRMVEGTPQIIEVTRMVEEQVNVGRAVELQVLHSWASKPNPEALDIIFDAFEAQNPDIVIDDNPVQFEAYTQMIKVVMPSKAPPDVIVHKPGSNNRAQIDAGLFVDLTDFWEENNLDEILPPYSKELWSRHGRIWGVPFKGQTYMVWYRPSIFEKVGVEPPETWDEFLNVCEKLKAAGEVPINAADLNPWSATYWFEMIILGTAGKEFYSNLMLGKESWTDERVITAFSMWKDLLDAGYVIPDMNTYSFQDGSLNFGQGKAAMYLAGTYMPARLWPVMPDVDIDYFLFPVIDPAVERTLLVQADGWMIPRKASLIEEAKKFLLYLASAEAQQTFVEVVGEPVVNKMVPTSVYPHPDVLGAAASENSKYQGVNPLDLALEPAIATEVQKMVQIFDDTRDMDYLKSELARIDALAKDVFAAIDEDLKQELWK